MNREELLKRKEKLEKQLEEADKKNNFMMCMTLGNALNAIDEKLKNYE